MINFKLLLIITIIAVLPICGCGKSKPSKSKLTAGKPRNKIFVSQVKGVSAEGKKPEALPQRPLPPDIYGRQDPFASIEGRVVKQEARERLELEGIIWDKSQPLAIINDIIVGDGGMIDGKKVLRIEKDRVFLEENGKQFELRLDASGKKRG